MSNENRKHVRFPFRALSITHLTGSSYIDQISTIAGNISERGVGLRSYIPLRKGSKVTVDLSFINKKGDEVNDRITGKVAWTQRKGDIFFAGVSFHDRLCDDKHPQLFAHFNDFVKFDPMMV
ncbi:MAG: PilZ domain-containing protein [Nitrospirota bacterium]|nr:MAG: PilZ domain-containing protein [Nitrospirota bacterium]